MRVFIIGLIAFLVLFFVGGIVLSLMDVDVQQTEVNQTLTPADLQQPAQTTPVQGQ